MITITREHEICMGHRVYGHESKCSNLHGHNYVFHFTVKPKESLDSIGRVVDFSEVKSVLCEWLEKHWDHRTILWEDDPLVTELEDISLYGEGIKNLHGIQYVPFNPTAENIASYFLNTISNILTADKEWYLYSLTLQETAKCSATVTLDEVQDRHMRERKKLVQMPKDMYCSLQCGSQRDCKCEGKNDAEKLSCRYCCADLPF
jgi:6-pyruvoyltetrahydropterin/6-carboxytetrahydropterin synthase